jgi:hypothetical protein
VRFLANASWKAITLIAVAWILAWLVAGAGGVFMMLRSFFGSASNGSGGLAAVGFSLNPLGAILIFGPPLALVLLRLIAPRFNSH